ncbi:MAG: GTPase Era [Eubacteriales bacterium]|nr:GTPase Era [Eubacteriales bacterium]
MSEPQFRAGFVALVGRSNVGKSTIINALVGEKVAIVSDRAQTTRNVIRGIVNGPEYQIVFVDTPGIHRPRTQLGKYMMYAADQAVMGVDVAMAVFDVSQKYGFGDQSVMDKLVRADVPVVVVLNKIDLVDKTELLSWMETLGKYDCVKDILPISAAKGQGMDTIIPTLLPHLPQGEALFDEELYTDQPMRQMAAEMIREKALWCLREEVPHGIGVEILEMREDEETSGWYISANILCERESHKGIIIGKHGDTLKKIGTEARRDIRRMTGQPVYLELWVKVKESWRDSAAVMRDLGYDKKQLDD